MNKTNLHATSLLEMILYLAIAAGILTTISTLLIGTYRAQLKAQTISEVEQQGQQVIRLVGRSVRNAAAINAPAAGASGNTLNLSMTTPAIDPTIVGLNGIQLEITEGVGAAIPLTSSITELSNLTFTNLSRTGTAGIIRLEFTISRNNPSGRNEYDYSRDFKVSFNLR